MKTNLYKRVSLPLWDKIKEALGRSLDALNDASGVVDPGEDEQKAYENETELLEEVLQMISKGESK